MWFGCKVHPRLRTMEHSHLPLQGINLHVVESEPTASAPRLFKVTTTQWYSYTSGLVTMQRELVFQVTTRDSSCFHLLFLKLIEKWFTLPPGHVLAYKQHWKPRGEWILILKRSRVGQALGKGREATAELGFHLPTPRVFIDSLV